ncbi:MAG: hypothetical protein V1850_06775, partial [Candidatus Bathyarchaeota archaeon]
MRWPKPSTKFEVILVIFQIVVVFTQITTNQIAVANTISPEINLKCISANSEVVLDSWGNINFHNSYSIQNIGINNIQVLTLHLPLSAEEVSAYDAVGSLGFTAKSTDNEEEVNITLRYPLRGNGGATFYNDVAAFTVSYRMRSRTYLTSIGSWTHYKLNLRLPISMNLTIKSLVVKVTLPEGAVYQTSSYSGNVPTGGLTPMIEYFFKDSDPAHSPTLTVDYEYSVFWSALRPTFLVGGVTLVIGYLIFYQRRRKQPSEIITDKNVTFIESFTEICDERLMLWSEIDSLEDSLDDKGIRRKDYNRKKMIMQQRLRTLDHTLTNLKSEIRKIKPRYAEIISNLEKAETAISTLG